MMGTGTTRSPFPPLSSVTSPRAEERLLRPGYPFNSAPQLRGGSTVTPTLGVQWQDGLMDVWTRFPFGVKHMFPTREGVAAHHGDCRDAFTTGPLGLCDLHLNTNERQGPAPSLRCPAPPTPPEGASPLRHEWAWASQLRQQ